ncbi:synaptopodin [Dromaius novaehollandiae]|uniref:synaptopodin n=1 Tax=Dromaius novaehollandiae TaxID=8790 RepID=UPI00311EA185
MLKATLRPLCLRTQPGCAAPGEASQNSRAYRPAKADAGEGHGCSQEGGKRGEQRCQQLSEVSPFHPMEQEEKVEPSGGKVSAHSPQEPGGLNGDVLGLQLDGSALASAAEPAPLSSCPSSELPPAAASPTAAPSQEWRVVKIERVLVSPVGQPRKAGLSRSASLSEKELKEAKAQSRRIAAQLTTAPGASSKGTLLFHRRKQRLDKLAWVATAGAGAGHGTGWPLSPPPASCGATAGVPRGGSMEGDSGLGMQRDGVQTEASHHEEPSAELQQVPLSVYLKENMASANGMHEQGPGGTQGEAAGPRETQTACPPSMPVPEPQEDGEGSGREQSAPAADTAAAAPATSKQPNGTHGKQYYEVHLTLAKPKPVKNRTARPFGIQASVVKSQPTEQAPAAELPPPPTYAETLTSPPPLTRVRSPPAYSALYPAGGRKPLPGCGGGSLAPLPKTGILEESVARRANKKSMFTFVEKPKLGPNPDLLDLVQNADIKKKQKEQGEAGAEEEPFVLGAEAANFLAGSAARGGQHLPPAEDAPAWSSCLKSPTIQPKPQIKPSHNLTEARGKGAELFARRQSRMEKFIIEAPSQPDLLRSPSPTMSLPPSWKYDANACVSPMISRHPIKSPSRPSKTPPASLYGGGLVENEVSQKELEISKHQPYQLQSSLFILSPSKGPLRSMPRGTPPPRPTLPDSYLYPQQTSCPTSPLPPSPIWHRPVRPGASRPPSGLFPAAAGAVPLTHDGRTGPGAQTDVLLTCPGHMLSPRAKGGFQAPRPSYSTRNAGIEPQDRRPSLPASPTWTPRAALRQGSADGWASPASVPELDTEPPASPPWSERCASPLRQEADPKASRQLQARLARNIINAARRKSSSPKAVGPDGSRPFTPLATVGSPSLPRSPRVLPACGTPSTLRSLSPACKSPLQSPRANGHRGSADTGAPGLGTATGTSPVAPRASRVDGHQPQPRVLPAGASSGPRTLGACSPTFRSPLPSPTVGARGPARRYASRSPTDSDVSLDSEESGARSPAIHSFNVCPRGWSGSLRLKQGGLPPGAPCTS